jgi:hypothetical protein
LSSHGRLIEAVRDTRCCRKFEFFTAGDVLIVVEKVEAVLASVPRCVVGMLQELT